MKNLSIKNKLYVMILLILIPMTIYQAAKIFNKFHSNMELELKSNEDFARVLGVSFTNYLERLWDTELSMGLAITNHLTLSNEEIGNYMLSVKENQPTIREYGWVDPITLKMTASSTPQAMEVSLSGREYIDRILNGQDKVVSNIVISLAYQKPTFLVARAIRKNNTLLGIVVATINVNELDFVMPSSRVTGHSFFGLLDKEGIIAYRSGIPDVASRLITVKDNPIIKPALNGETVRSRKYSSAVTGESMIGVNLPVQQIGWVAYANTSYDEVFSMTLDDIRNDLIILLTITLLCAILSFKLGQQILNAIGVLENSAIEMSNGNLNVRTNITGKDEIAAAALAFDQMADSIDQYDKLKTQFFSNISHELKTPLNIILASIQMIQGKYLLEVSGDTNIHISKYASMMKQNCYRLLRLINNLIDITRIDSGFFKFNFSNYNIVSVVEDITISVANYSDTKGINITFDTDIEEKVMAFDPDKIERIMLNLLSNSIKFTPPGGNIFVNILDKSDKVLIVVKDTGIGIPPDKLSIIFERFRQIDSSLQREYEGSGIGLSLVKALVEAHKGKIYVTSELNEGTEFTIELPCVLVKEDNFAQKKDLNTNLDKVQRINIEFSDIYK